MGLKKGILIDIAMLVVLAIVGLVYLTWQEKTATQTTQPRPVSPMPTAMRAISPTTAMLANPASVNCSKVGGTIVIQKLGDGSEYGLCEFANNQACEEWALYRKSCPIGGIKTDSDNSTAQKYCAWLGGKTYAVENATCTLPSGKVCNDDALYNGTCSIN